MPVNHVKPTKEELDAQINASLQELEKESKPAIEAEVKKEEETPKTEEKPVEKEEEEADEVEELNNAFKTEAKKADEEWDKNKEEEKVDYKKKFSESTRESVILYHQSKKLLQAIEQASAIAEPTDDEMTKEYTDWELMDDAQKKMAKETLKNRKALASLGSVVAETKNIEAWNAKVDQYILDPKTLSEFPDLEGKEDDFKVFATKETRRGADFELLTQAFLGNARDLKVKHKGSMFERPTGGPNDKSAKKNDKISLSDAEIIKQTDYKRWMDLVKAGKIASDID